MAKRDIDDGEAQELEAALDVVEAHPLAFDVGGKTWHLRQPSPAEITRLRLRYDIAKHEAWQDVERAHLSLADVASLVENAGMLGYLRARHEAEEDAVKRRDLADRIDDLRRKDDTATYDNISNAFALAERDRQAIELLLEADDVERAEFIASAGAVEAARPVVWRALALAGTVPNWNGRQPSVTG